MNDVVVIFLVLVLFAVYLAILHKNDWTELYIPAKVLAFIGGIFLVVGIFLLSELIYLESILLQKGSLVLMVAGIILMILSLIIDVSGNIHQERETKNDQAVNRVKRRKLLIRGAVILGIIIFVTVAGILFFY